MYRIIREELQFRTIYSKKMGPSWDLFKSNFLPPTLKEWYCIKTNSTKTLDTEGQVSSICQLSMTQNLIFRVLASIWTKMISFKTQTSWTRFLWSRLLVSIANLTTMTVSRMTLIRMNFIKEAHPRSFSPQRQSSRQILQPYTNLL